MRRSKAGGGATRGGLRGAYRLRSPLMASLKSLFTCHGVNKKIVSCFFKNQSIVLQRAGTLNHDHHDHLRLRLPPPLTSPTTTHLQLRGRFKGSSEPPTLPAL